MEVDFFDRGNIPRIFFRFFFASSSASLTIVRSWTVGSASGSYTGQPFCLINVNVAAHYTATPGVDLWGWGRGRDGEKKATHLRFIEMICRYWKPNFRQQFRHTRSITHMPIDQFRTIQIFQTGYHLHRPESSYRIQSTRSCSEQVTQHPIVRCEPIDESARDDRTDIEPCSLRGSYCRSEYEYVLD